MTNHLSKQRRLSVAIFGMLISTVSAANYPQFSTNTTGDVAAICTQPKSEVDQAYCNGFGQGAWDAYLVTRQLTNAPDIVCPPESKLSRDEILTEFYKWIAENPKLNELPAAYSIIAFMSERFRCKD